MRAMNCKGRSQKGFSIVEVMVVVAIMSIVATGTASMLTQMIKASKTQAFAMDLLNVHQEMRSLLQDPPSCLASLGGAQLINPLTPPFPNFSKLVNSNGSQTFNIGQQFAFSGYSLTLAHIAITAYQDTLAPYGRAQLTVAYTSTTGVYGSSELTKIINLETRKDGGNHLVACVALTGMSDSAWNFVPNTTWDISYNSGNVGIGTPSPSFVLDVNEGLQQDGGIRISGVGNSFGRGDMGLRLNNVGTGGTEWYIDSTNSTSGYGSGNLAFVNKIGSPPTMILGNNGNVGIGNINPQTTLDVSGGIRPGSASQGGACSVEGSMAYDYRLHSPIFCNGKAWIATGLAPVGKLHWDGNWTGNNFWCDAGYHKVMFHTDCNCSNNSTWWECQAN